MRIFKDASNVSSKDDMRNVPTTIHTRINENMRISSVYREYKNEYFSQWGWETLLWENDIVKCDYINRTIDDVIKLHADLYGEYKYKI